MKKFKVAAIQMNSKDVVSDNLETAGRLFESAAAEGARLIVLPEYANYLSTRKKLEHAESLEGDTIHRYRQMARRLGIYLNCGSFVEKSDDPGRAFNTSVLIDPNGEIAAAYRKIHLFDVHIPGQVDSRESKIFKPGNKVVTVDTHLCRMGFTICYDLRFPEQYRALTDSGARLIMVPAAFTLYTGKDHWETLLRARAIENQVFIVAAGQFGSHPVGNTCFGGSMVIDPWGTVISRASEGTGYALGTIDPAVQERIRRSLPCLDHRVSLG